MCEYTHNDGSRRGHEDVTDCVDDGSALTILKQRCNWKNNCLVSASRSRSLEKKRVKYLDYISLIIVQSTDIPLQELRLFVHVHAHNREVWLRPTDTTLYIECTTINARAANKRCLTLT